MPEGRPFDAGAFLQGQYEALCNAAAESDVAFFNGAVAALEAAGLITSDQEELWERRLASGECPEGGQHPGRSWCAFCGQSTAGGNDA